MVILKNSKQEKIQDKWNYYQIADIISPRKIIISNYFKKLYFNSAYQMTYNSKMWSKKS